MKIVGIIIFIAGILLAISGGAKIPDATFSTDGDWQFPVTWPVFVVGAAMGIWGCTIWRLALHEERMAAAAPDDSASNNDPVSLIAGLFERSQALQTKIGELTCPAIVGQVDDLLEEYVLPFADVRQKIIDRCGMSHGAEILVTMAFGERMLNRMWSAAADEHIEESRACCPEAVAAIEEANRLIQEAT